jgi:hypothetical protein
MLDHIKSHSTSVLIRYPLRRQVLMRACTASGERSGIEATGLPFPVQPSSTVAGSSRLRVLAALSRRLSSMSLPVVSLCAALLHIAALTCVRPHATATLTQVSGGDL